MNKYKLRQQICFFRKKSIIIKDFLNKKLGIGTIVKIYLREGIVGYTVKNYFEGEEEKTINLLENQVIGICNNLEDFKRDEKEINIFLQQQKDEYNNFISKLDKDFIDFIKNTITKKQ